MALPRFASSRPKDASSRFFPDPAAPMGLESIERQRPRCCPPRLSLSNPARSADTRGIPDSRSLLAARCLTGNPSRNQRGHLAGPLQPRQRHPAVGVPVHPGGASGRGCPRCAWRSTCGSRCRLPSTAGGSKVPVLIAHRNSVLHENGAGDTRIGMAAVRCVSSPGGGIINAHGSTGTPLVRAASARGRSRVQRAHPATRASCR